MKSIIASLAIIFSTLSMQSNAQEPKQLDLPLEYNNPQEAQNSPNKPPPVNIFDESMTLPRRKVELNLAGEVAYHIRKQQSWRENPLQFYFDHTYVNGTKEQRQELSVFMDNYNKDKGIDELLSKLFVNVSVDLNAEGANLLLDSFGASIGTDLKTIKNIVKGEDRADKLTQSAKEFLDNNPYAAADLANKVRKLHKQANNTGVGQSYFDKTREIYPDTPNYEDYVSAIVASPQTAAIFSALGFDRIDSALLVQLGSGEISLKEFSAATGISAGDLLYGMVDGLDRLNFSSDKLPPKLFLKIASQHDIAVNNKLIEERRKEAYTTIHAISSVIGLIDDPELKMAASLFNQAGKGLVDFGSALEKIKSTGGFSEENVALLSSGIGTIVAFLGNMHSANKRAKAEARFKKQLMQKINVLLKRQEYMIDILRSNTEILQALDERSLMAISMMHNRFFELNQNLEEVMLQIGIVRDELRDLSDDVHSIAMQHAVTQIQNAITNFNTQLNNTLQRHTRQEIESCWADPGSCDLDVILKLRNLYEEVQNRRFDALNVTLNRSRQSLKKVTDRSSFMAEYIKPVDERVSLFPSMAEFIKHNGKWWLTDTEGMSNTQKKIWDISAPEPPTIYNGLRPFDKEDFQKYISSLFLNDPLYRGTAFLENKQIPHPGASSYLALRYLEWMQIFPETGIEKHHILYGGGVMEDGETRKITFSQATKILNETSKGLRGLVRIASYIYNDKLTGYLAESKKLYNDLNNERSFKGGNALSISGLPHHQLLKGEFGRLVRDPLLRQNPFLNPNDYSKISEIKREIHRYLNALDGEEVSEEEYYGSILPNIEKNKVFAGLSEYVARERIEAQWRQKIYKKNLNYEEYVSERLEAAIAQADKKLGAYFGHDGGFKSAEDMLREELNAMRNRDLFALVRFYGLFYVDVVRQYSDKSNDETSTGVTMTRGDDGAFNSDEWQKMVKLRRYKKIADQGMPVSKSDNLENIAVPLEQVVMYFIERKYLKRTDEFNERLIYLKNETEKGYTESVDIQLSEIHEGVTQWHNYYHKRPGGFARGERLGPKIQYRQGFEYNGDYPTKSNLHNIPVGDASTNTVPFKKHVEKGSLADRRKDYSTTLYRNVGHAKKYGFYKHPTQLTKSNLDNGRKNVIDVIMDYNALHNQNLMQKYRIHQDESDGALRYKYMQLLRAALVYDTIVRGGLGECLEISPIFQRHLMRLRQDLFWAGQIHNPSSIETLNIAFERMHKKTEPLSRIRQGLSIQYGYQEKKVLTRPIFDTSKCSYGLGNQDNIRLMMEINSDAVRN